MADKAGRIPARRSVGFSPKEFLKARRPERFSDTVVDEKPILDRSMLEYHLETLTNRSQEVQFATFARHLSEREICPNLLPQTGPTGGGDSKVDSETYPVADELALGWYTGIGREAASERWGFAFSTKKKWQDKVRSDVAKIAETGRSYKKVFFVTNQYVRDKARAEMEDELEKQHGFDVRICDRTWILDKVFSNGHETLAIEDLELRTETRKDVRRGPLDARREVALKEIEERIQEALRSGRLGIQLAEDCIESALLARQLERPATEIDGLYERAEQITAKCGTRHQCLECAYQRAWTAFWWLEDYDRFSQFYETVEARAKGSWNSYDLELLSNLWSLLQGAVIRHQLDEGRSALSARTEVLLKELGRLVQQEDHPSSVLHARSLGLQTKLSLSLAAREPMESILREYEEVVRSCEGLAGFPLEPLVEILMELGEIIGDQAGYDDLFQTIVAVQARRKGEVTAARMLLARGKQQLKADQPYDAICTLGLSLGRLYKHESRDDAIRALYLCGCAYERVGLLWAARGTLLSAASLATNELWKYGEVTSAQAACYRRLKWLELQLGRIPQALSWHEVGMVVVGILIDRRMDEGELSDGEGEFDAVLGLLLLKTDHWELKRLSALPDVLDRLGLFSASSALMYALGYEDDLGDTFFRDAGEEKDMHSFFIKWRDQPASKELPERPSLYEEQKVTLKSYLLGCDITVETANVSPCLELAESALAALESLLSTGTIESMIARESVLTIAVRKSDFAKQPFEFELQDHTGRPHIDIVCGTFDAHRMPSDMQKGFKEGLFDLLTTVLARIVMTNDPQRVFEKLFRDERVLDRSVNFTGSFVTVANVLGHEPKSRISSWSDPGVRDYPPKRSSAWDADDLRAGELEDSEVQSFRPGEGEPPDGLLDHARVRQTNIRTVSLIREPLWDKAKWVGTAFATPVDEGSPPTLALAFNDPASAKQIFQYWRSEVGIHDVEERLRVVIVRGISKINPFWYRVLIGSNPGHGFSSQSIKFAAFISRINTMEPRSNTNLERFLHSFGKWKEYFLTPAVWKGETMDFIYDSYLVKRELFVRPAWEIGRNDPDGGAIQHDDLPIIPDDQENPPIKELLRWKQGQRTK